MQVCKQGTKTSSSSLSLGSRVDRLVRTSYALASCSKTSSYCSGHFRKHTRDMSDGQLLGQGRGVALYYVALCALTRPKGVKG